MSIYWRYILTSLLVLFILISPSANAAKVDSQHLDSLKTELGRLEKVVEHEGERVKGRVLSIWRPILATNQPKLIGRLLMLRSQLFYSSKRRDSLYYYLRLAENYLKSNPDLPLEGEVNFKYAYYYLLNSDYNSSFASATRAKELFEQAHDYNSVVRAMVQMGYVVTFTARRNKALSYYHQARAIAMKHNLAEALFAVYNNVTYYHIEGNRMDSAEYYIKKADKLLYTSNLSPSINIAYKHTVATYYYKLKQYARAHELLDEALAFINGNSYFDDNLLEIYELKALISFDAKEIDKSINYSRSALQIAKDMGQRDVEMKLAYQLSRRFAVLGKYEEAYALLRGYSSEDFVLSLLATKDSIAWYDDQLKLKAAEIKLKEEQMKNAAMVKDIELVNKFQVVGVVIAFLLLLVTIYAWNQYRKVKVINALLVEKSMEVEERKRSLELANNTKDKMMSIVSHDLRGPIGAMRSLPDILQYLLDNQNYDELEKTISAMASSTESLNYLVDSMLQWSSSQVQGLTSNAFAIKLKPDLERVAALYQQTLTIKELKLDIFCSPEIEAYVDANIFFAVMRNLVQNATKFSFPGQRIVIRAWTEGAVTQVSVQDYGRGIAQNKLEQMFSLEHRFISVGTGGEKGSGLGLFLVVEMLDKVGGNLSIDSAEGVGTVVTIALPATPDAPSLSKEPVTRLLKLKSNMVMKPNNDEPSVSA